MIIQRLRPVILSIAVAMIVAYLAVLGVYLLSPIFFDHVEAQFPWVSWYFIHGHPLYHEVNNPELYILPYGPFPCAIQGLALILFGPTIFSVKLVGVAASTLAVVFAYLAARQYTSRTVALVIVGFLASYWIGVSFQVLTSRADVWMLLFVLVGFWASGRPGWSAAILLGLCIGLCLNIKIHGPVYFLPLVGVALRRGLSWPRLLIAGAIAAGLFLLPFATIPNLSLANYVAELSVTIHQGLSPSVFLKNLGWLVMMVVPLLGAFILSWANDPTATLQVLRNNRLTLIGLGAAIFLIMAVASKPGAGAPHLVPLASVAILVGLQLWQDGLDLTWRSSSLAILAACLLAGAAVCGFGYGFYKIGLAFWSMRPSITRNAYAVEADTKDILQREGSKHIVLMGVGDIASYPDTFFRCDLVFGGMPIGFSPNTIMDRKLAHMPMPSLARLRDDLAPRYPGKSIVWIIPKGKVPFAYVFDDKFRTEFNLDYVRFDSTPCFDLYIERAAQP